MFQKKIPFNYVSDYVKKRYLELEQDKFKINEILLKNGINLKKKSILDLAAGPGTFEVIFTNYNPSKITYFDSSKDYLKLAKENHNKLIKNPSIINYKLGDLMDIYKFKLNEFDFIFCNLSLYYASNETEFFSLIQKILINEGFFYFVTPSKSYLKKKGIKIFYLNYLVYILNKFLQKTIFPVPLHFYLDLEKIWVKFGFNKVYYELDNLGLMHIILRNEK